MRFGLVLGDAFKNRIEKNLKIIIRTSQQLWLLRCFLKMVKMARKWLVLIIVTQHGFYSGIESVERVVIAPLDAKEWVCKKIEIDFLHTKLNQLKVDEFVKNLFSWRRNKDRLCSGEGDYEIELFEIELIENV